MSTVTAIYEHGVFRPLGEVRLPERTRVEVTFDDAAASTVAARPAEDLVPQVRALRGSLRLPTGLTDNELIARAREERHGPL